MIDLDGLDGVRAPERERVITPPPIPDDEPRGVQAAPPTILKPAPRRWQSWMALPLPIAALFVLAWSLRAPHKPVVLPPAAAPIPIATPLPTPLAVTLPARFRFNRLTPDGDTDAIAAVAARCTGGDIVLTGHADALGSERANRDIALRRADAVRALLAERGIDAARVRIGSAGSTQPIASDDSAAGRRENRRVTLDCKPYPGGEW
jgi:hypothetical protein